MRKLSLTWDTLGGDDPFWAVLSEEERREGRWNPKDFYATGPVEVAQLKERLARYGLSLKGERALDFGCGVGRISQALGTHFDRVDGVDISAPMLDQARRFNTQGPTCQFTQNHSPNLKLFEDETFDFVYSRIVLQHMPASLARCYIAEFYRVLRPGGILFFQIPAGWNLSSPETFQELRHHVTVPRGLYKAIRRLVMFDWLRPQERKDPRLSAEFEMHFTPVSRVMRLLERFDLQVAEIKRDNACGEKMCSYNYLVTKPANPPARLHSRWAWRRITSPD